MAAEIPNGNGKAAALERAAENAVFKMGARAAMWACPLVCAVLGYLIDDKLKSIDTSIAEFNRKFNVVEISVAVAASENRARDDKLAELKLRVDMLARQQWP